MGKVPLAHSSGSKPKLLEEIDSQGAQGDSLPARVVTREREGEERERERTKREKREGDTRLG
jgi:hypothetical protein